MTIRRGAVVRLTTAVLAAAAFAACQFDEIVIPRGEQTPIVHGVLNPGRTDQVVLLERLLTGAIEIPDRRYQRTDPIVTGSGDPLRDALVVVYGPNGDSAVAAEDIRARTDGRGAGVYRFRNGTRPGELVISPGGTYRLRVVTLHGAIVNATTTVPDIAVVANQVTGRSINRDLDTLHLFWDPVPGTSRYLVHVDGPNGALSLFTTEFEARLPGTLRSVFQSEFPLLFIPGFRNRVDVAAVDPNYYDYYRSGNDPFTGTGLINHIDGGIGLFGSVAELFAYSVSVSGSFKRPIEGVYGREGSNVGRIVPPSMTLYIVSEDGERAALSGSYQLGSSSAGIIGTLDGANFTLDFLDSDTELGNTVVTFTGTVVGDSLIGTALRNNQTQATRYGKRP